MKVPLSWLKEFLPTKLSAQEVAEALTLIGLEVDSVSPKDLGFKGVVVVTVLETSPHPKAENLVIAKISDGKNVYSVVCGARNCRPHLKTAFAKPGVELRDAKGNPYFIKKTEIKGVLSEGMLCSASELGLEKEKSSGIIELPENYVPGEDLGAYLGELILEIALTPNLSHCTSVRGIARELAAVTQEELQSPKAHEIKTNAVSVQDKVRVSVENTEGCLRYMCRLIENVKVGPSPDWLKERIEMCGLRSVNNVVDVTNFVLMEMGHPLHAFDFDTLSEETIIVRNAHKEEKIVTLDGKEHFPSEETLLICDKKGPVAIAGIMGALSSEVGEKTSRVLLEAAYFDPKTIRRAAKRMDIHTEASYRFERGTDPNGLAEALERATSLICEVASGTAYKGKIDVKAQDFLPRTVFCRISKANALLGTQLAMGEVETLFRRLSFQIQDIKGDVITVKIPTYRQDVHHEIDLIEEIARIYGFDNIHKKEKPTFRLGNLSHSPMYLFEKEIRSRLLAEGLLEFLTCDLISPEEAALVTHETFPSRALIKILNPSSSEQSVLRPSLLSGLLKVIKYNFDREIHTIAGFELGRVHFKSKEQFFEPPVLGIVLTGKRERQTYEAREENVDFLDLKGHLENLFDALKIKGRFLKGANKNFHPGRQATVFVNEMEIGTMGEVHPQTLKKMDIKTPVLYAELNLEDLARLEKKEIKMAPLPQFPSSTRDLTITLEQNWPMQAIFDLIASAKSELLQSYSLRDVYANEKIGKGKKNVTLRFIYRDLKKTVSLQEVEKEHQRITEILQKKIKEEIS